MNSYSLRLERNAQSFEPSAASYGMPASAKFQMKTISQTTRIEDLQNGTNCDHTRSPSPPFRQNTARKSTRQNGAEGVFLDEVGGLPPQLANKGLNAVLEGFDPSPHPNKVFLAFPGPGHLPSSRSIPAAMFFTQEFREKIPHPARIQNDGLFWPVNRKGCLRLRAHSGAQCPGSSTLPCLSHSVSRAHLRPSERKFASAHPALASFCSRRLIRLAMSMHIQSLPYPGARAGVFVVATQVRLHHELRFHPPPQDHRLTPRIGQGLGQRLRPG